MVSVLQSAWRFVLKASCKLIFRRERRTLMFRFRISTCIPTQLADINCATPVVDWLSYSMFLVEWHLGFSTYG